MMVSLIQEKLNMAEGTFTFQHVHDLSMNEPSSKKKYMPGYTLGTNATACIYSVLKDYNNFYKLLLVTRLSNDSSLDH